MWSVVFRLSQVKGYWPVFELPFYAMEIILFYIKNLIGAELEGNYLEDRLKGGYWDLFEWFFFTKWNFFILY